MVGWSVADGLVELLDAWEVAYARAQARRVTARKRRARGRTLRPGPDTPAWLALAERVRPLLAKRGARTLLGRELGLHGSRITEFFFAQTAMPDAERTLLLLSWLSRQTKAAAESKRPASP
jgi:hypothetical protein